MVLTPPPQPDRRGFLGLISTGAAGLAAGAAAGWFGRESRIPPPPPEKVCPTLPESLTALSPKNDLAILNEALALEHQAIFAYAAGAPLLSPGALAVAKLFLEQHEKHRDTLKGAIEGGKGTPVAPLEKYDLGLPEKPKELDVLLLALKLEEGAVNAYRDRLPKIFERALITGASAILGDETMHVVVLREALKLPPPEVFSKFPPFDAAQSAPASPGPAAKVR